MPHVPAICRNCGFIFPSGLVITPHLISRGNVTSCPRCLGSAPVLDGYGSIIDGMVAFITSPSHPLEDKKLLIDAAIAVSKRQIKAPEAVKNVSAKNEDAGRLLREWVTLGLTFISTMATVAAVILAYSDSRGNEPLEELATKKFDEILVTQPQPDLRPYSLLTQSTTNDTPDLSSKPNPKGSQRRTAEPKAPNENRKMRRARIKKNRTKIRK